MNYFRLDSVICFCQVSQRNSLHPAKISSGRKCKLSRTPPLQALATIVSCKFDGKPRNHTSRLEAHLGAARLPLFFPGHVRIAVRQRHELYRRELVHPRLHALNDKGKPASHRRYAARLAGAVSRRRVDRQAGSPLSRRAAGFRPRNCGARGCIHRLARTPRALAPVCDDADHRDGLGNVLGHGKCAGAGSDSAEPVHRRKRCRADRRAKRHADRGRICRIHLR